MTGYQENVFYDYVGASHNYSNDEDYLDYDLSPNSYNNGFYDDSSSPSSGIGLSSSAMTPSASHSSHGSEDQYHVQEPSQHNYVDTYDEYPSSFDQPSRYIMNQHNPQTSRYASKYDDFEYPSPMSPSPGLQASEQGEVDLLDVESPEDCLGSYSPQEFSPISPISSTSPSRSRKPSKASKSDISFPCLFHGCTSTARFRRAADLQRHYSSVHNPNSYDCPIRKCRRKGEQGLGRRDHLRDHLKEVHMQSPEQVKVWMEEVQIMTRLKEMRKKMTPEELVRAQEMERSMPSARSVLPWGTE